MDIKDNFEKPKHNVHPMFYLMQTYKEAKHADQILNWDKIFFKRYAKNAKELFTLCNYDLTDSITALQEIIKFFKTRKYSYWDFGTIVKYYPDWKAGKLKTSTTTYHKKREDLFRLTNEVTDKINKFEQEKNIEKENTNNNQADD